MLCEIGEHLTSCTHQTISRHSRETFEVETARADTPRVREGTVAATDGEEQADFRRWSGEFVDPRDERAFLDSQIAANLSLYSRTALVIAAILMSFSLVDATSLGLGALWGALLIARAATVTLVLITRSQMLRHPQRVLTGSPYGLIATTELVVLATMLLATALRPDDAATSALSFGVVILGSTVLVPGRFRTQVVVGLLAIAGLGVLALTTLSGALSPVPLAANLVLALVWGLGVRRMTGRDARRRWHAVAAAQRANERLEAELVVAAQLRCDLQVLAERDPLTSAANRREFLRVAEAMLADRRDGGRFALLLLDADRFKSINDRFGHGVGDAALVAMTTSARAAVRDQDLVARIGGEEFAVLLPGMSEEAAAVVAERVRRSIAETQVPGAEQVGLSVSIGLTAARPDDSVESLLARADDAMYSAKHAGGDRFHRASAPAERARQPVPSA